MYQLRPRKWGDDMSHVGYYPDFRLPDYFTDAEDLRTLLHELWQYRYDDLYEDAEDGRPIGDVQKACERIVSLFTEHNPELSHRRLVYLGRTLALAVAPTVTYLAPEDSRPQQILDAVRAWLKEGRQPPSGWTEALASPLTGVAALNEARYVLMEMVRALNPTDAPGAILNMLDSCLQEYPIFPGSRLRRDLFNWVLIEAVPAAWNLRLPNTIYDADGPFPPAENERKYAEDNIPPT
jgi:hypothetical protein